LNNYKFTFKGPEGEKCYYIPGEIMENRYGLPEEEEYTFLNPGKGGKVIYLSDYPKFNKRKDSRRAI
jgi:hypothetical protein